MTYTYKCEKCGKEFEVEQKMTDGSLVSGGHSIGDPRNIIECEGKVKRIITGGTGFILKGKGWTKPRTKSQKKVDEAIKRMGVEDESDSWEVGE